MFKQFINRVVLSLKDHAPQILIGAGVTGTVVGGVCVAIAVTKVTPELEAHSERQNEIARKFALLLETETDEQKLAVLAEGQQKEERAELISTGLKVAKAFLLPVGIYIVSLGCIFGGARMFRKRSLEITAAYATLGASFEAYRKRIMEKYGGEADAYGLFEGEMKTLEEKSVDPETGEITTKETHLLAAKDGTAVGYARVFAKGETTESRGSYLDDMSTINYNTCYFNTVLQAHGFVYLNEVYDVLGFPRTAAGQSVGWVYDPDQPEGDNRIDLRPTLYWREVEGIPGKYEKAILIDPNVDGVITDHALRKGFLKR